MKKFLSIMLCAIFMSGFITMHGRTVSAAVADDGIYGWAKVGDTKEELDNYLMSVVGSDEIKPHGGKRCLRLRREGLTGDEWGSGVAMYTPNTNLDQHGKYRLSFSLHGEPSEEDPTGEMALKRVEGAIFVRMGWSAYGGNDQMLGTYITNRIFTKRVDEDNWATYTSPVFDFSHEENANGASGIDFWLFLMIHATVYIDDITLVRVNADGESIGENLIVNSGFEYDTEPDRPVTMYEPVNPMIDAHKSNELTLGWENPRMEEGDEITGVKIYDITDGGETEVASNANLDLTSGKTVTYTVSGLENGKTYAYKLVFEFANHAASEVLLSAAPGIDIASSISIPGWTAEGANLDGTEKLLTAVSLDTEVKHGGNASLRINSLVKNNGCIALYCGEDGEFAEIPAGDYKLSYWMKTDNASAGGGVIPQFFGQHPNNAGAYGTTQWHYYEKIISTDKAAEFGSLGIFAEGTARNVWIDDMALYPIDLTRDADGNITSAVIKGKNLLADYNCGFENENINVPSDIGDVNFDDLDGVEWAREAIGALAGRGIVGGYGDNKFMPDNAVSREEFAKMLAVVCGITDVESGVDFEDVRPDDWFYPYVAACNQAGIINGVADNRFGTGMALTRQDMAAIVYRAAQYKEADLTIVRGYRRFADASDIDGYAEKAVQALYCADKIRGTDANMFEPLSFCTRAQAAKLIYDIFIK